MVFKKLSCIIFTAASHAILNLWYLLWNFVDEINFEIFCNDKLWYKFLFQVRWVTRKRLQLSTKLNWNVSFNMLINTYTKINTPIKFNNKSFYKQGTIFITYYFFVIKWYSATKEKLYCKINYETKNNYSCHRKFNFKLGFQSRFC